MTEHQACAIGDFDLTYDGIIPVRTSFGLCRHSLHAGVPATQKERRSKAKLVSRRWNACMQASVSMAVKRTMYQGKVDVDMLNAVKSVLADALSVFDLTKG